MAADGTVGPNLDLVGGAAGLTDTLVTAGKQDHGRARIQTHDALGLRLKRVAFSLSSGLVFPDADLPLNMPFQACSTREQTVAPAAAV